MAARQQKRSTGAQKPVQDEVEHPDDLPDANEIGEIDSIDETGVEDVNEDDEEVVYGEIIEYNDDDPESSVISNPVPVKRQLSATEKTRRAIALKLAGASYTAIARQLGYADASGAKKAVQRGMNGLVQEDAKELRAIHYARLEHMLMLVWPDVNQRDYGAMGVAVGIMDRIERLHGLTRYEMFEGQEDLSDEGVLVVEGGKDEYIKGLKEASKRQTGI